MQTSSLVSAAIINICQRSIIAAAADINIIFILSSLLSSHCTSSLFR